jgi:hypothetical protein
MSSGLPLIAPDRGGVISYANSTNAWVVPPVAEAFAEAARDAVFNDSLRTHRIASALKTAENYRWENVANSFLDLYEDLRQSRQGVSHHFPADFVSSMPPGTRASAGLCGGASNQGCPCFSVMQLALMA